MNRFLAPADFDPSEEDRARAERDEALQSAEYEGWRLEREAEYIEAITHDAPTLQAIDEALRSIARQDTERGLDFARSLFDKTDALLAGSDNPVDIQHYYDKGNDD